MCGLNWPDSSDFRECERCGEETSRMRLSPSEGVEPEPAATGPAMPGSTDAPLERRLTEFRAWLETVTADDFRVGP